MRTVTQTIAHGRSLLGERIEVRGIFVMNRQFACFVESIDDRENHRCGLRVDVENLRKIIVPRVLPRVGGAFQYSDEARIVGTLKADETGRFAFKIDDVEQLEISKLGEWHKVIP